MGKRLAKLGIDWSNSSTFVMLWFVFSFIAIGFFEPHHGFPGRRIVWSMNTNESVPDWFPIPLFPADPEKRVVVGTQSSLVPDEHIILGVTTHAEWTGTGDTLRVSDATGAIVAMRRQDVIAVPLRTEIDGEAVFGFSDANPARDDANHRERFPLRIDGGISRGSPGADYPPHDLVNIFARYPRNEWAEAYLVQFDGGSIVAESVTLHLPGISRAAVIGMTKAAAIGAAMSLVLMWLLRVAARRNERQNA